MEALTSILAFSAPGGWEVLVILALIIGLVLTVRLFGAWMLRINEVIDLLRSIKESLKQQQKTKTE